MNLRSRIEEMEARLPPPGRSRVPDTKEEFWRGLLERRFGPEDIDRTNADHISWLAELAARCILRQSRPSDLPVA